MANDIKKYSNEILYRDFFYSEIIKRHVEEFDEETWNYLNQLKESLKEENNTFHRCFTYYENIFNVVLGEAIDMYRLVKNGYKPFQSIAVKKMIHDVPELFSFKDKQLYDKLLDISYRYNIIATEIIFPCNMRDVIDKYSKKQFSHWTYKFKTKTSDNVIIIKNGEKICTEGSITNENEADFIKEQFVLQRIYNREETTTLDYDFTRYMDKKYNKEGFRTDAFIKNAIGLYCWDCEKKIDGNFSEAFKLYKKYRLTINSKECKNKQCYLDSKIQNNDNSYQKLQSSCSREDTCTRFVRDARRLSRLNITDKKIHPSSKRGDMKAPKQSDNLKRYPLSFFGDRQVPPSTVADD